MAMVVMGGMCVQSNYYQQLVYSLGLEHYYHGDGDGSGVHQYHGRTQHYLLVIGCLRLFV